MNRYWQWFRWLAPVCGAFVFNGCVTNQQLQDFARIEIARLASNFIGGFVALVTQATG